MSTVSFITDPLTDETRIQLSTGWTTDLSARRHRRSPGFIPCYVEEVMSITRAKLAELEINKDMDTAEERGKDNNESEVNTAAR